MESIIEKDAKPAAKGKKADGDHLSMLVEYYEDSEEESRDSRDASNRARDYYDNKQYTAEELAQLEKRGQPPLTFNKIKRKVNFLTGHESQTKADPKAYPRNYPADEDGAEAATDAMRYVQQGQMLEDKFSSVFENMIIEGFGGLEVLYNPEKGDIETKVWAWDRLFYDPHSSKADFSDAQYVGGVVWMDEHVAKEKYPGKDKFIDATVDQHGKSFNDTHDDKPRTQWVQSGRRKRVMVVQIYFRVKGEWWWAHYTKGGILDGNKPVIFKDEDGASECPMILQSGYVDRENNRYGEVRELIDYQDEVNKRRSKLLYQLSVRQVRADKGAVDNKEAARKEIARPDGWIETNPGRTLELLGNNDQISGQAQLLQDAKSEMEFAGPNASLMGDTKSGASGRAIIASQQGGLTELGRFLARYKYFKMRVYRQIWNRVRQFWTAEKWVRVTDDEQNIKFVGLNIPETLADVLMKEARQEIEDPDELKQIEDQIAQDPQMKQPTGKMKNNVAEMDMDIIIDEAPDTITIQQEQFEQIVNLAQAGIPFDPEDIVMLSTLRNKDKVLERMQKRTNPQPDPQQQELQQRGVMAEIGKAEGDAAKSMAEAENKQADTEVKQIDAATKAHQLGMHMAGMPPDNKIPQ